jgi:hypothetical protein
VIAVTHAAIEACWFTCRKEDDRPGGYGQRFTLRPPPRLHSGHQRNRSALRQRSFTILETGEIKRAVTSFASPNAGLILETSTSGSNRRGLIIALAAQYKLPAIYVCPFDAKEGALVSYGPDPVEPFRRAADYVDRILEGGTRLSFRC